MNKLIRKIVSKGDEVVLETVRRSLWHWFWPIVLAIILINLPFFLIYPLFQYGQWGLVAFFTILILAMLFLYRIYLGYYYTALLITSKRLIDIDQRGFFGRSANTILYGKIQDVNSRSKGIINMILRTGDIYITFTKDKTNVVRLDSVRRPSEVVEMIMEQREIYMDGKRSNSGSQAVTLLKKIRRRLGEDKYAKLISD